MQLAKISRRRQRRAVRRGLRLGIAGRRTETRRGEQDVVKLFIQWVVEAKRRSSDLVDMTSQAGRRHGASLAERGHRRLWDASGGANELPGSSNVTLDP